MAEHLEIHSRSYVKRGDEEPMSTFLNISCDDEKCTISADEETLRKLRDALGNPDVLGIPDLEEE